MNNPAYDALLGSFTPTRLDLRLYGPAEQFQIDSATVESVSTWVHENFHFQQAIFSGYGQIAWDSHRQATSFLFNEWIKLPRDSNGKRRIPLAHCAPLACGEGPPYLAYFTVSQQLLLGSAKHSRPYDGGLTLAEIGSKIVNMPWSANPTISLRGQNFTLQGKDVIEGHAHFVERSFREHVLHLPKEVAWSRDEVSPKYLVAMDWFIEKCGVENFFAFPILCDLALQTSWIPVTPITEADWRASNPAWRFVRLADELVKMKDVIPTVAEEFESYYENISTALLERCGYMSLECVLNERLSAFERKAELLNFEVLMKSAILYRKEHPWCLANPAISIDIWTALTQRFKSPILVLDGKLISDDDVPSVSGNEIIIELQFQAFAAQILGDFSTYARNEKVIECAFAKYNITAGCEFQRSHGCSGRFDTNVGAPHKLNVTSDGSMTGCSFEMLLYTMGLTSEEIDLDPQARFTLTI